MKKGLAKFLALVSAGVMSVSLFSACDLSKNNTANMAGYVAVDINPSVEFITDSNGKVLEVRAVNEDAQIILSDENLVGKDIAVAVEKITQASEETGYINDTNTDVSITVSGETTEGVKKLKERAEKGVRRGSKRAQIKADDIRIALEAELEKIKESNPTLYENLTVEQLKIINSIMEYDRSFTLEEGSTMSIKELVKLLKEYIDEHEDFIEDSLEDMFEQKFDELSAEIKEQINAIYNAHNPEYSVKKDLLKALEMLENKFERELEKDREQVGEHRFNFERDFDDEDLENEYEILTDAMKEELTSLIGENTITSLDELDDYIDSLEEEVEEILEEINFTEIEITLINSLKEQLKAIKEQAKLALKGEFERVKNEFRGHKEHLKGQHGFGREETPGQSSEVVSEQSSEVVPEQSSVEISA